MIGLKTSSLNSKSLVAIIITGAVKKHSIKKLIINEDGIVRDTVYISFIKKKLPQKRGSIFKEFLTA